MKKHNVLINKTESDAQVALSSKVNVKMLGNGELFSCEMENFFRVCMMVFCVVVISVHNRRV